MRDAYQSLIFPDLQLMLQEGDRHGLAEFCEVVHPVKLAEMLEDLETNQVWTVLDQAELELRVEIFENISLRRQAELVETLDSGRLSELLEQMSSDDRVDLLTRIPQERREDILRLIAKAERNDIRRLLSYDEWSAGAIMTTEYASLPANITVRDAIERLRLQAPNSETIYYVYILDDNRHLEGLISLRELILAKPETLLAEIMQRDVVRMRVSDEREAVAQELARYNFLAVPIVDDDDRLVGIVTHDDALDVVQEEATEDAYLQGGVQPLEDAYEETPILTILWKRGIWLVFLSIMALANARVLDHYTGSAGELTALILMFLPLVMASGGNTGSQSATLFIRMIALQPADSGNQSLLREHRDVITREIWVALLLGALLAAIDTVFTLFWFGRSWQEAAVIGGTVVSVVVLGTSFGAVLPLILQRLGLDPAIMSNALIASILDILAVTIFFQIAIYTLS
ncbi:MAG: magnesium transporter [Planctomycetaceae bacterium]|nr:magnesium transporter [Planctomycetaceae bacterium]